MAVSGWHRKKEKAGGEEEVPLMPDERSIPARTVEPHSQLSGVTAQEWQRRSCGVVALRMLMGYLDPARSFPSLDGLIAEGVEAGAYMNERGWRHDGLAALARAHGFTAADYDWTALPKETAFSYFLACLAAHPVIASVAKAFSPSEDGHLVVVTGIQEGQVFVNDPLREKREDVPYSVPLPFFLEHWSRRAVVVVRNGETCRPRYACWLDLFPEVPLE
jgi:hypothetical protein